MTIRHTHTLAARHNTSRHTPARTHTRVTHAHRPCPSSRHRALSLPLARSRSLCAPVGLSIYLSSVAVPRARASPVIWPPCPALAARPPMPRDALNVRGHVGSCRHSSPCRHSPPPDSPALPAARPEDPLGPPRTPSLARKSLLALLSLSAATPRTAPLRLRERRARQYRYVRAGAAAATVVHWHTWGGGGARPPPANTNR